MKEGIHPKYYDTTITCACGTTIKTRSTKKDFKIEICSACHPFFTGSSQLRLVDTEGRVDRFKKKYAQALENQRNAKSNKAQPPESKPEES